jgi:hypothetical protein
MNICAAAPREQMTLTLTKTFAVPPHFRQRDVGAFLAAKYLNCISPEAGFVTKIHSVTSKNVTISSTGNYIYESQATVDCYLPAVGDEVEAVVQMNRAAAHTGLVKDHLRIIFYSEAPIAPGTTVSCVLTAVKFQMGTYRAIAEMKKTT